MTYPAHPRTIPPDIRSDWAEEAAGHNQPAKTAAAGDTQPNEDGDFCEHGIPRDELCNEHHPKPETCRHCGDPECDCDHEWADPLTDEPDECLKCGDPRL